MINSQNLIYTNILDLTLFQYPQGINLHKIFYTPFYFLQEVTRSVLTLSWG